MAGRRRPGGRHAPPGGGNPRCRDASPARPGAPSRSAWPGTPGAAFCPQGSSREGFCPRQAGARRHASGRNFAGTHRKRSPGPARGDRWANPRQGPDHDESPGRTGTGSAGVLTPACERLGIRRPTPTTAGSPTTGRRRASGTLAHAAGDAGASAPATSDAIAGTPPRTQAEPKADERRGGPDPAGTPPAYARRNAPVQPSGATVARPCCRNDPGRRSGQGHCAGEARADPGASKAPSHTSGDGAPRGATRLERNPAKRRGTFRFTSPGDRATPARGQQRRRRYRGEGHLSAQPRAPA